MKRFLIIAIASCCVFTACEKEGSMSKSEIVGEWFAEYHVDPRDPSRIIQCWLDFDSNKKGNYNYHRLNDGYAVWANFTWEISGGRVICTGVLTDEYGYVDFSWDEEYIIDGNTLVCGNYVYHKQR